MDIELDRFLDSVSFSGRLALDGSVQRYGRKGNQWIWSLGRGDNTYVVAGDWSTGERVQFGKRTHGIQQAMRQLRDVRAERATEAAKRAVKLWAKLNPKPTGRSYLERKGVAGFGLRYAGCDTYVPMRRGGSIVGLQRITPTGEKRFTPGCAKRGAFHMIEGKLSEGAVLCEGYATGASIHMATGREVIVAFDCGNLLQVARTPSLGIEYVAADNDLTPGNPGVTHARDAAAAIDAKLVTPPEGYDFNDVHAQYGLDEVRRYFA